MELVAVLAMIVSIPFPSPTSCFQRELFVGHPKSIAALDAIETTTNGLGRWLPRQP